MGTDSHIEWTDHTWGPWRGCTKVSAGCKHCYMFRDQTRYGNDPSVVVRAAKGTFNAPLAKNRDGSWKWKPGSRVFVCSWSDFFHADADAWRDDAWRVMAQRPDLTWILVTKRPERMQGWLAWCGGDKPWPNVIGMVSVENQEAADKRIPLLLDTPFAMRGISAEPLLGEVDLISIVTEKAHRVVAMPYGDVVYSSAINAFTGQHRHQGLGGSIKGRVAGKLDWVIVGGESGPDARPMHPEWARSLRDQCAEANVPFFFKQWGEWADGTHVEDDQRYETRTYFGGKWDRCADDWVEEEDNGPIMYRIGKSAAGRLLDGREHNETPWEARHVDQP